MRRFTFVNTDLHKTIDIFQGAGIINLGLRANKSFGAEYKFLKEKAMPVKHDAQVKDPKFRPSEIPQVAQEEQEFQEGEMPADDIGEANPSPIQVSPGTEESPTGIITALATLPEKALLEETAMTRALGVSARTIRRMVDRHELPPPIPLAGRSVWIAGRVFAYLDAQANQAEKEAEQAYRKIQRIGS